MTIQSYAWAMDQPVPGNAFRVLLALANHAEHTTGQVHFDAPTMAAEALIQVSSLPRYLSALERNGYLSKDELKSADGDRRDYWLILDRDRSLPWSWSAQDGEADEESQPLDSAEKVSAAAGRSAPSAAPAAFRRDRQVEAREAVKAAEPIPPPGQFPVIEGSRAFEAWNAHFREHKRVMPFTQAVMADGHWRRGVYMPSLFPPAADADRNSEVAL